MTQQLVDSLNSQVEKYIHGPHREDILALLEQSPTADAVAEVTHKAVMAIDAQASERGAPVELDVLMGVATETIDMLIEIMQAMGIELNVGEVREESLLKVVMLHMESVGDDPEQKAAAQEMLAVLTEDGTMQKSMAHIDGKADASTKEMQVAGQQMVAPKQKPLTAGIQRGLMDEAI
jgi:hypothetical protein